ncbi:MAG TPA: pitrilysin family protein [Candidatus Kapabacteria bacterium]|nr:pitrilysin family protein [Candidatus Kapabacteria bacterium]
MRTVKYLLVISLLFLAGSTFAQKLPNVEDFTVNGIRVILRQSPNQIVAIGAIFRGGYAYNETNNPYIAEGMANLTTSSGSEKYPKDKFRALKSRLVTTITGGGDFYDTQYWLRCVKPNFDQSWDMFSDVIMHPLYDDVEFRNQKENDINNINNRSSSPDGYAYFLGDSAWRSGNARFGRITEVPDIQNTTIADMKQFHNKILQRGRMYVVVVGNVSKQEITKKLGDFASQAEGNNMMAYSSNNYPPPDQTKFIYDSRPDIPTTYIYGFTSSPDRNDPDFWPSRLTASYLREKFFQEVRTKRNLSYAPFAFITGGMHNYRFVLGVSTTRPDSAIGVMLNEIKKVQNGDIDTKMLNDEKNVYITRYYQGKTTNLGQAQELYGAIRETGDWHDAYTIDKILTVTPEQAKQYAEKYLHNILYSISGPTSGVTESKFHF